MHMIISINSPGEEVLFKKTEEVRPDEIPTIEQMLYKALEPYFPAAGLAAPQIGISKAAFIFSYDRDPAHLELVVNPSVTPIDEGTTVGWEACLSVIGSAWKLAKLPRYNKIKALYTNSKGEKVEKVLEGFAAKAFQHECDHLQGVVCICHPKAEVKEFESKEAMLAFLAEVKKEDTKRYSNSP